MRNVSVIALLTFSLLAACGAEKVAPEPTPAVENQVAPVTPAVPSDQAAAIAEERIAGVEGAMEDQTADVEASSATPTPQPATPAPASLEPVAEAPAQSGEAEPSSAAASLVSDGAAIFGRRCATCHGKDGSGDTAMGRRQNIHSLASAEIKGMSDAELTRLIREGAAAVSRQAHMNKIKSDAEMRAVIAWIRSLGQT